MHSTNLSLLECLPFKGKMYKIMLLSYTSPAINLLSLHITNRSPSLQLYFPPSYSQNDLPLKHKPDHVIAVLETPQMFPVILHSPEFGSGCTLRVGHSSQTLLHHSALSGSQSRLLSVMLNSSEFHRCIYMSHILPKKSFPNTISYSFSLNPTCTEALEQLRFPKYSILPFV